MDFSQLAEYIPQRKSVRKYNDRPVAEELIEELVEFLSSINVPESDIDWNFDTLPFEDMVKISATEPGVKAPYYLVLRAERKNFYLQNMGYIGALASLWLCSKGVGTCWQGSLKITEDFPDTLPYVAAIAFGYTDEPMRKTSAEFDRNPAKKMSMGFPEANQELVEAVRLAPSALNKQPVSILYQNGRIHFFRKYAFLKIPALSYVQCIDTGIAMAHLHVAASKNCKVVFDQQVPEPIWGGRIYQATANLEEK